ncbi:SDR family oxidoreductase [Bauldia litoralis]
MESFGKQNLNGRFEYCVQRHGRARLTRPFPGLQVEWGRRGHKRILKAKDPSYIGADTAPTIEGSRMANPKPIALVTGANKGIGLEIARQLAGTDVTVIIGARDRDRGRKAADELLSIGLPVESVEIDLNDEVTIAAAAEHIAARHGRLDILVNNAGIVDGADGPPTTASTRAVRRVMETNFIGTLAVTQAMLPLLRKSPAGRIVNLATSLGSLAINSDPASPYYSARLIGYNASKAALNMLTVQLTAELRDTPIVVNSVSPGYVKTDLTGHTGFMTPDEGARLPVAYALLGEDAVSGRFVEPDGETPW